METDDNIDMFYYLNVHDERHDASCERVSHDNNVYGKRYVNA